MMEEGRILTHIIFTREIQESILTIAHELTEMNKLKEIELILEYGLDNYEKAKNLRGA